MITATQAESRQWPNDAHDTELDRHVAPPAWVNPTSVSRYHLVVIGAGPAGLVAAAGAAGLGARVALIEKHRLGGDCLNYGCVPSKAVLKSARVAATVRDAGGFGVNVPVGAKVDFAAVMERMRRLRVSLAAHDAAERFQSLGVDVFLGCGRFTSPDSIEVGGQTLRFRRALIATGARAALPKIPGLAEAGFVTNETVFSLNRLPKRLAVLGAGPIGCELAQAFARFGSHVTLLASERGVLPKEDHDAAKVVESAMRRDGIEIVRNARLVRVGRNLNLPLARGGGEGRGEGEGEGEGKLSIGCEAFSPLPLTLSPAAGERGPEIGADELLVAVGRTPNIEGLGLEHVGIAFDPREGVRVDDHFRTSHKDVFAAGDVCSKFKFTHAADAMARIVLQNALFPGRGRGSSLVIPRCTYTDPEIAEVGLTEIEAREQGLAVDVLVEELSHVDRAVLDGETAGFAKVLVRKGTDQIIGATIVATNAGDMLSELTLAMTARVGLGTLAKTIHPYPTQAEVIKRLADQFQRRRLTPFVKKMFECWFAWTA